MIRILYPERRSVSEATVIGWAQDELVNAVIQHKNYETDEEMDADIAAVHASEEYRNLDVRSAMDILGDVITFAA